LKLILNPRSSSFCTIVSVFCAQMSKFWFILRESSIKRMTI
jgi:hypothetical protein